MIILRFLIISLFICNFSQADDFLKLHYSPLADCFQWLDQTSKTTPRFFQMPEYRTAWISRFGESEEDIQYFENYQQVRKKYQEIPSMEGFFAPDPERVIDPIADAFYSSDSLENALDKLTTTLIPLDLSQLKECFSYFEPRLEVISTENSKTFDEMLKILNSCLSALYIEEHLKTMCAFYNATCKPLKSALVFSAPEGVLGGNCYGHHISLKLPADHTFNEEEIAILSTILVHEATHHISGSTNKEQKRLLSDSYGKAMSEIPMMDLEEPLVIASQMYFIKKYYPQIYEVAASWFFFPLAEAYFPLLEGYLEANRVIDQEFIQQAKRFQKS
jgi:hypothetical protein